MTEDAAHAEVCGASPDRDRLVVAHQDDEFVVRDFVGVCRALGTKTLDLDLFDSLAVGLGYLISPRVVDNSNVSVVQVREPQSLQDGQVGELIARYSQAPLRVLGLRDEVEHRFFQSTGQPPESRITYFARLSVL